ncbi:DNA replication initiation control protein YabA [Secundilactobacillus similis]|uniref:Initiation-control protein YabA n=1 Tax=Secundilactobacillus similis DSM 23365 = JCM 2765 TaxID=1423804 RepID=A0A0R2ET99_9LACO|nr:DNA replication initiation control protein YabA [Secundilactobacillus similis]KRN16885.1 hypothetical protein FD14_GL002676 [Secundilactobacillus similis DSM 23365 = JCM 2765]
MKKPDVYEDLKALQLNMDQLITQFEQVQEEVTATLEQNAELTIENQHLRELVKREHDQAITPGNQEPQLSKGLQNLVMLYDQGFHICNDFYGERRKDEEECAFCLSVLYGKR